MMKLVKIILIATLMGLINFNAQAADIEEGTISIGGTSNAMFQQDNPDPGSDSEELNVSMEAGYFFFRNLEIGVGIGLDFSEPFDDVRHNYSLLPYLRYNWSLSEKSSIYTRIGGGWGHADTGWTSSGAEYDRRESMIFGEIGYEHLLAKHIALDLGVGATRTFVEEEWDHHSDDLWDETEHQTVNSISSVLRFKFYF